MAASEVSNIMSTLSVSLRLQRTTVEEAFVSVMVTSDLIVEQEDGTGRIDTKALFACGVAMGESPDVVWVQEEQRIETHPIQKSPYPNNSDNPDREDA